ncbi:MULTISPECIES: hypothetical protein [Pseudomonas]|uniref:Uncharacterized protein n=2 Tax=Pseudomonas TaxID=286 RepID=A0A7Z1K476_9PSED|nr:MULTISPECIES: hypothetical protein [Pseudomonas]PFG72037.1 hypothetical protein DM05_2416 [Pseudomonas poae]PUB41914.1 hypothetical protein C8K58_10941 [Pseudomonas sp. GV047]SCX29297.1 hypothetical protein SAMN03159437_03256 [Pseudomonas sp. NFACC25]SMF58897.1 hypothetical protein SAMN05660912_04696 [Pseudomonas sp. LAMO17WK12:I1]
MSPTTRQPRKKKSIIHHRVVFADEGEKHGWTGGGNIILDDVSGRTVWLVQKASRIFSEILPPRSQLTVLIYCRVRLTGSYLKVTHAGGSYTSPNIMSHSEMSTYWVRNATTNGEGKFWIDFETSNGQALRIHQVEVMGPATHKDTDKPPVMKLLKDAAP